MRDVAVVELISSRYMDGRCEMNKIDQTLIFGGVR